MLPDVSRKGGRGWVSQGDRCPVTSQVGSGPGPGGGLYTVRFNASPPPLEIERHYLSTKSLVGAKSSILQILLILPLTDPRGVAPPRSRIFLISCSFFGESGKFICCRPLLRGILNPLLTTEFNFDKLEYESYHFRSIQLVWRSRRLEVFSFVVSSFLFLSN